MSRYTGMLKKTTNRIFLVKETRFIHSQSLRDILLEQVLDTSSLALRADGMAILHYSGGNGHVISHKTRADWNSNPPVIINSSSSISYQCIQTGKFMVYRDITRDNRLSLDLSERLVGKFNLHSAMCYPLLDLDNTPFASFSAYFSKPISPDEEEIELFKQFGNLAQTAISRKLRSLRETKAEDINQESISDTLRDIHNLADNIDGPDLFNRLLSSILCVTQANLGFIGKLQLDDQGRKEMRIFSLTNISNNEEQMDMYDKMMKGELTFAVKDNVISQTALRRETFICNDVANSEKFRHQPANHIKINNFMSIPLWNGDEISYIIGLGNRDSGFDTAMEHSLNPILLSIQTILKNAEFVLAKKQLHNDLQHANTRDNLTKVSNLKGLEIYLEDLLANKKDFDGTLCFIDIDNFSALNKLYGKAECDKLLKQVVKKLGHIVRNSDHISRIGGDRFGLLLTGHKNESVLNRILTKLQDPVLLAQDNISLTFRMGAVQVTSHESTYQKAIDSALSELKKVKDLPLNRVSLSRILDNEEAIARNIELQEINYALRNNQFVLYAQPIVDFNNGNSVDYFEILARWKHPERGILPPSEFLPIIELEQESIVALDNYVITSIIHMLLDRLENGLPLVKLSANLTPETIVSEAFLSTMEYIQHLPEQIRKSLCVEVVECYVKDGDDRIIRRVNDLKNMGVTIALDDFGTGYSNIARLSSLSLDVIKIDRSFISTLRKGEMENKILSSVFQFGSLFDRKIVSEGIEDKELLEMLVKLGCSYGQGYLFGKPQPIQDIIDKTSF